MANLTEDQKSRSLLSTWSTKKELKNIVALNMHHSINMAMAIWATYSI